ncbi:MAG TPA: hypothetical protein VK745_25750 [Polyangiaceae bacterium]|jgi:hypothetical protein|nr:hypothetical protein [Polyangiaceae bacterium]
MKKNFRLLLSVGSLCLACSNAAPATPTPADTSISNGGGGAAGFSSSGGSTASAGGGSAGNAQAGGAQGGAGNGGGAGLGAAAGASGSSGAAGAAGSTSACSGLFCEDFELGMIDPAKWDLKQGAGGTAVVESTLAAHGKYALQVHGLASNTDDYALIVTKAAPAALQGTHFGRAYFFITPKPLTSGHTSMVFAGMNGSGSANGPEPFPKLRYMELANINGGWQMGFDLLDISPLVEEVAYPAGSPQVPTTVWTCMEWQFTDTPDTINLWIDGQPIGTFDDQHVSYPAGHTPGSPLYNGTSSGLIGSYQLFGFGFHDWHPHQPFDLYFDDIVLDTKRVGCLPDQPGPATQ